MMTTSHGMPCLCICAVMTCKCPLSNCICAGSSPMPELGVRLMTQVRSEAPEAVDAAMSALQYGCIAVNTGGALPFALTKATWGGFPGTTIEVRTTLSPWSSDFI